MKIKRGDTVKLLYGKDAGKTGMVLAVNPKSDMIVVDGVNMYKRSIKGDGQKRKSEIINIVKPLPASKVMVVCPSCGKPTRVGLKRTGTGYERLCKKCGKTIDRKPEAKKEAKKTTTKKSTKK
jgi:large subunit ribosomal protein L24